MEKDITIIGNTPEKSSTLKIEQEEESDGGDQDSSISEEIEPKLKYMRMTNDIQNILTKDAASCIAVHTKFLCVGCHWGDVHLLDHQGNNVRSKELHAHSVAVNQISIDHNGDFIASCSDDGKVFIHGLYTADNNHNIVIERLVKSIAIDPNYYKAGSGRRFITGDERLVLHEKTFLSRLKSTVLCEAEGGVRNIKWNGHFVAWASDIGVRVYDMNARVSLGLIKWQNTPLAIPDKFRCNLCWSNATTLLVGWIDTVRVCMIRKRSLSELANRDLPQYVVEPVSCFSTEFLVCGLGPLDNQLVILGYPKELDENGKSLRPQLYVVEPREDDYTEICTDSLSLRGYQEYKCNDYHLECLIEENRFFVVSPKDVIVASPYDADDRVQWLMEHCHYEAAMEAVSHCEGRGIKRHNPLQVGKAFLDHLLATREYDRAAKLCIRILGTDKQSWQEEVFKFATVRQLRAVSKYLPVGDHSLDPHIYEMVLYELLKTEPQGFLALVKDWPPNLYHVTAVINAVLEHLLVTETDKSILLEALAILYSHEKKYDKSLSMYLRLEHKDVFQLIPKHDLYGKIHDMIEELMDLDADQTVTILLDKRGVSPDIVVQRLENNRRYLYLYLDALERKDMKQSGRKYHSLLVELYAEFSREKLLPLLKRSDQYSIQEALDMCKKKSFHPETVYLLGFMGNAKGALQLIIEQLCDIDQAIIFCKEHDDVELWDELIISSLDNPEFIKFLLERIGSYVDPRNLVGRIPGGMQIPGLQNSLVKMMHDFNLQVAVQEGCKKILASDYFNLHERLVHQQQKGILVNDEHVCGGCHRKIIVKDVSRASTVVVFFCRHMFHEECLPSLGSVESCMICSSVQNVHNYV